MRVDELRGALEKYDKEDIKEIAVSLYKMLPKKIKDEKGVDELITDYSREKAKEKTASKSKEVDFTVLKKEVLQFIDYADMGFYFSPNNYVRKEKRSKWRFEVKRFIKELLTIKGENSLEAAQLLCGIFDMLSYSCDYYTLNTENPFSAVGCEQSELLKLTIDKLFYSGFNDENIKKAVFLTLDSNPDYNTFYDTLLHVLINCLKTSENRERASKYCSDFQDGFQFYQSQKSSFKYATSDVFRKKEWINRAVKLYLLLKINLYEFDDGIKYFINNSAERDREVTLYYLLDILLSNNLPELWIREYEAALKRGIKPRESLQEKYKNLKTKLA